MQTSYSPFDAPFLHPQAAAERAERRAAVQRLMEQQRRCRALPPLQPGEAERLAAEFAARRGITRCPPAFSAPVQ